MFSMIHLLEPSSLGLFLVGRYYDYVIQSLYYTVDPWIPPHPQHSIKSACNFIVSPPHALSPCQQLLVWSQFLLKPGLLAVPWVWVLFRQPQVAAVQSLSCVWLFVAPWTTARWASLSITVSWSLLRLMCIESVTPSNQLILCYPLLLLPSVFPSIGPFPTSWLLASGGWISTGGSASSWVLPMNIQGWFPLVLIGLIALQSKGLSRVFSKTTVQKHQFFSAQPCGPALTSIHDSWKNHSFDYRDLCQLFELWGKS